MRPSQLENARKWKIIFGSVGLFCISLTTSAVLTQRKPACFTVALTVRPTHWSLRYRAQLRDVICVFATVLLFSFNRVDSSGSETFFQSNYSGLRGVYSAVPKDWRVMRIVSTHSLAERDFRTDRRRRTSSRENCDRRCVTNNLLCAKTKEVQH